MSTISFQIHPSFRPRQQAKIDRPNSRLYGIVAGMDVEATGHGVCCDVKSLELIAQLANGAPEGISGRFGHPGMSENATGRKVHLAYNWRVLKSEKPGDKHTYLVHDSQFMDAARTSPAFTHDPVEYIMNMAEQHPKHFAESLVLSATQVWTTEDGKELPTWEEVEDADGYKYKRTRKRPDNALTNVPVLRPTAVHFCDFVNDGAITHSGLYPMASPLDWGGLRGGAFSSIFTEENAPNYLLDHLFATVDDLCRRFNIPLEALQPKVKRLLSLYIDSRSAQEATTANAPRGGSPSGAPTPSPVYFSAHPRTGGVPRKDHPMSTRRHRLARHRNRPQGALEQRQELGALADPAVNLTDQEELAAETDEALGHASAILSQAEQMANSMVQSTVALTDAPTLASAAQVAHLQDQLDQHTDQLHDLTTHLKKLSELLVKNMELTNALQRNIARANGETVVTQRVPVLGATGGLEGFTFQQPAPGAWAAGQQPISTEQRRDQLPTGIDPDSPEARTIRRQQQRAQQTRQG
ncbi:MAG: hypothetical protein DYG89_04095 [Caldilinea sp. CFX5]|nr:hypothetical protein [Caldilinea sp. CFX5]